MWEFIDKVVYINLDRRPEKNEYMKKITSVFPSEKVVRFSAIEESPGYIGCTKSHIAVMRLAIEEQWKNILILEDDVSWNRFDEGYKQLEKISSQNYDVIHLGPSNSHYDVNTFQLYTGYTTSSYLVNGSYLPSLLSNFEEGLHLLLNTNNKFDYTCDVYWNKCMKKDRWYTCMPVLMYQKDTYSDIDLMQKLNSSWFWTLNPNYVNVELHGGLGNQLFQLAFLDYVSRTNSCIPVIDNTDPVSTHSNKSYFETIFKKWNISKKSDIQYTKYIREHNLQRQDWKFHGIDNTKIYGYFQNYIYIDSTFHTKLDFSTSASMLEKYPDIRNCVFIHIRGGDYLTESNNIYKKLTNKYYTDAIGLFPTNTEFVIFTNDIQYALTFPFLNTIKHKFIDENEVDSLFLMSNCIGGICANSTFSWWGALLSRCYNNHKLPFTLPSQWFNNLSLDSNGYYFSKLFHIIKLENILRFSRGKFRFV